MTMTPEQEARLGQMMQQEARKSGHVKKPPPDAGRKVVATQDKIDVDVSILILKYLKANDELVHRMQIIKELGIGSGTIDRCLRKLAKDGKARRVQNSFSTRWEAIDWTTVSPTSE